MDELTLFATPVFVSQLPQAETLNPQLCALLLAEQARDAGLARSNVGGWHSQPDLAQRADPHLRTLMQALVDQVGVVVAELAARARQPPPPRYRYGLESWAMVMRDGDYTLLHDHADAHWSAVYFADAAESSSAEEPHSGLLAFVDPRRGGRPIPGADLFPSTFTVRPRSGVLVLFPGWLQHYVHPYRGGDPRISISCNVTLEAMRG